MQHFKESTYNIDLVKEGYIEGLYTDKQVYNTNTNTRAVIKSDIDYDNPPEELTDTLVLIDSNRQDDLEYIEWRQKEWVFANKPHFVTIGLLYDGMNDRVKDDVIDYLIREIARNRNLLELAVWVQTSCEDKEEIEQFLKPVQEFCKPTDIRKGIEFDILWNKVTDESGACSLKYLDGDNKKWMTLPCPFEARRNVIIANDGSLYRCIKYVGTPYHKAGTIYHNDLSVESYVHKKCKTCKLLPLCNGGCICQKKERADGTLCESVKNWLREEIRAGE